MKDICQYGNRPEDEWEIWPGDLSRARPFNNLWCDAAERGHS